MVPSGTLLPDPLPTDRLNGQGKPTRVLRDDLRRIPNGRNALTTAICLAQTFGVVISAAVINQWWAYALAFLLMARGHACLNILAHESAHRLLFTNRRLNDVTGRFLLAYPSLQAMLLYRRAHIAHHRDELGPDEPDIPLYRGYPIPAVSWRRKLTRDALGISASKNFASIWRAARAGRKEAIIVIGYQVAMCGTAVAFHRPLAYVVWITSWSTLWKVSNRLRAIAEHGGMIRSDDRRQTTHVIRQSIIPRYLIVPYYTGWHLAHHVDMGIPWRNLPRFHDELVASGWVQPELEYATYRAFWKAASSG